MNTVPVVIAGCLLEKGGKFLLIQEATPSIYGLWNTPAGHVDKGESIEEAAVRETREESGFNVVIERNLGVYQTKSGHEIHVFFANIMGGELAFPRDEILDAKWLTKEEIESLGAEDKLRGPHILSAINAYLGVN